MRGWIVLVCLLSALGCQTAGKIAQKGLSELEDKGVITEGQRESIERTATALRTSFQDLTDKEEYYIGRAVAANILHRYSVYEDETVTAYVNKVGKTVAWASDRPETYGGYHFLVLDTPDPLAYSAPGGFIFVSRGLMKMMENEEELAGVLAHEVAHVNRRHGLSAIKQSRLMNAFSILVEEGKKYSSAEVKKLAEVYEGSLGDIIDLLLERGYSRSQEGEADRLGALFAHRAGYDPQGLVSFLDTQSRAYGSSRGVPLLKTHPNPGERRGSLQMHMKEEGMLGRTEVSRTSRFLKTREILK